MQHLITQKLMVCGFQLDQSDYLQCEKGLGSLGVYSLVAMTRWNGQRANDPCRKQAEEMTKPNRPFSIEYRFLGAVGRYAERHGFVEWRLKSRYRTKSDRDQAWKCLTRKDVGFIEYRMAPDENKQDQT